MTGNPTGENPTESMIASITETLDSVLNMALEVERSKDIAQAQVASYNATLTELDKQARSLRLSLLAITGELDMQGNSNAGKANAANQERKIELKKGRRG